MLQVPPQQPAHLLPWQSREHRQRLVLVLQLRQHQAVLDGRLREEAEGQRQVAAAAAVLRQLELQHHRW